MRPKAAAGTNGGGPRREIGLWQGTGLNVIDVVGIDHREDDDYYSQPRLLFRLMTAAQKKVLFENTARAMGDAPEEVKLRHIENCRKADPAYGEGVARALGIAVGVVA